MTIQDMIDIHVKIKQIIKKGDGKMEEKKLNDVVQLNKNDIEEVSGGGGFAGGNLGGIAGGNVGGNAGGLAAGGNVGGLAAGGKAGGFAGGYCPQTPDRTCKVEAVGSWDPENEDCKYCGWRAF